jgi:Zn-dependent M28 family amino/carboxypeptidase
MKLFPRLFIFLLVICATALYNCKSDAPSPDTKIPVVEVKIPKFDENKAYEFVEEQIKFGPRVPNTDAHQKAKDWMVEQMESFGADVIKQGFEATAYTGEVLKGTNIIAQYNPDNSNRILLCAHWDSRYISDHDPDESKRNLPVVGADDGGSGVGVLMEIGRQLQQHPISLGVDIIFFDLEDQGEAEGEDYTTWCLGSQYWAKNPHKKGYNAKYGILLDMVGKANARFTMEEVSMNYAPSLMRSVWNLGRGMGYPSYFVKEKTRPVIDDHLFVNQIAKIPTINIINRPENSETGFHECWHAQCDDMSVINKNTLRAVGQTVLATVYRDNNGKAVMKN